MCVGKIYGRMQPATKNHYNVVHSDIFFFTIFAALNNRFSLIFPGAAHELPK